MKTNLHFKILFLVLLLLSGGIQASDTLRHQRRISINDISCSGTISGDGFGIQYVPSIGIRFGERVIFSVGPMFSPMSWKNTGFVITSRVLLMRENESYNGHFSFSTNVSFEQFNCIKLSAISAMNESLAFNPSKRESTPDFKTMTYNGYELFAGFEVGYRFRCGMLFRSTAGFTYTDSHQNTSPEIITVRDDHGMSLSLGVGLGWKFGKMMSQKEHDQKMFEQQMEEPLLAEQY